MPYPWNDFNLLMNHHLTTVQYKFLTSYQNKYMLLFFYNQITGKLTFSWSTCFLFLYFDEGFFHFLYDFFSMIIYVHELIHIKSMLG